FTYLWHDITMEEFEALAVFVSENGTLSSDLSLLELPYEALVSTGLKTILENLLVLHRVRDGLIVIAEPIPFIRCLGLGPDLTRTWEKIDTDGVLDAVNRLCGMTVRARAPVRIGARMGRPEKSDKRKMSPAPHVLFPIGDAAGNTRKLETAAGFTASMNSKVGEIKVEIGTRVCPACGRETHESRCDCGEFTVPKLFCQRCGISVNKDVCPKCGRKTTSVRMQNIDFKAIYQKAFERLGEREGLDSFKGVKRLMSKHMTPEPLEKGVLRAKHGLFTFKDGTVRYDMSDIPLTHIRPDEIGVSAEKLRELGYDTDIRGAPFTNDDQVVSLKVQDLVISYDAADYILKITQYLDDLLVRYYRVEPYYNAESIDDIVGVLLMGLAPHTSAGVLGR
ncbi:MAG: DNA polymerase II large subunit, partial [Methanosarcinaceae archaeon]|nr:DNA polymerase II large subunit [Methanosarcinaceae archaeon]